MQTQGKEVRQGVMDTIVSDMRIIRDAHIRELMRDPALMDFLEQNFEVVGLSVVRREFLKRELQELMTSSLDLVHYGALIRDLRDADATVPYDHPLFTAELKMIFQRYV